MSAIKRIFFNVQETNVEFLVKVLNIQPFEYRLRERPLGWQERQDR